MKLKDKITRILVIIFAILAWTGLILAAKGNTITWDKIDVEGYRVNYRIIQCGEPCEAETKLPYSVDVGNIDFFFIADDDNFQQGKCYKFQVSAYNSNVHGPLSNDVVCTDENELWKLKKESDCPRCFDMQPTYWNSERDGAWSCSCGSRTMPYLNDELINEIASKFKSVKYANDK